MDFILDNATYILIVSLSLSGLLLCLPSRHSPLDEIKGKPKVVVLVLGDIGRSPRMQYHAISIAKKGGTVELVGYNESYPRPELVNNDSIKIHAIPPPPSFLTTSSALFFPIAAPLKILLQLYRLLVTLLYVVPSSASHMLLQTPPSMPTFIVAWIVARLRRMKIVIDWHNFGWTLLRLKFGRGAPIVQLARLYELMFGRIGDVNFTVTESMKEVLLRDYGIRTPIHTLYDRPPIHFHPISLEERASFLLQFPETASHASSILSKKTRLILSSTSWTPDEDFQILLDSFIPYDREASLTRFLATSSTTTPSEPHLPELLVIITGKGPLKDQYLSKINGLELQNITVKTVWLKATDYPKLLACADLGICLHKSSSGVDLPMKVVDMFGVGIPVLALGFKALPELVKAGVNGSIVPLSENAAETMGKELQRLFKHNSGNLLETLKAGALKETENRWESNWDNVASPVFGFE